MSETPAMSRPADGADDFERRLRAIGRPAATEDPLAELARLVGQDDPFKALFAKPAGKPKPDRAEPVFGLAPAVRAPVADAPRDADLPDEFAAFAHDDPTLFEPLEAEQAAVAPALAAPFDPRTYPVEPSPDAWAQGEAEPVETQHAPPAAPEAPASTGRTLIVLAAVVVLTGGGLAASFLARPSGAVASVAREAAPTIMALSGPAKVQPAPSTLGDGGQSEPSTLLDKNRSDGTATAKVVDTVEQPVDLSQAVKPAPASPEASSAFPEPRKVRTVVVRPDGSILAGAGAARGGGARGPDLSEAGLAFDPRTAIPMPDRDAPPSDGSTAAAAPRPAAPAKVTARAADETTDTTPPAPKPRQASAPVHARPKPVQTEEASLTTLPDSGAPTAAGGYAVQLGAPPTAQEAHDVSLRLQRKFAEQLGGNRPSIHEAKSGDKSVFRIRVGGLSQDDARALCSKLQAGGGACFVVHN